MRRTAVYLFAVMAALGADDEEAVALVEDPASELLYGTPAGFGARVDRFDRPAPRYGLDPERVAAAIESDTAFVTVTNRHTPSEYRSDRSELAAEAKGWPTGVRSCSPTRCPGRLPKNELPHSPDTVVWE